MAPMPPPGRYDRVRWSVSNAEWSVSDQAAPRISFDFQHAGQFGQFGQFLKHKVLSRREFGARTGCSNIRSRSRGSYLDLPADRVSQKVFCRTPVFHFLPKLTKLTAALILLTFFGRLLVGLGSCGA
jgi:hypothetical protein